MLAGKERKISPDNILIYQYLFILNNRNNFGGF